MMEGIYLLLGSNLGDRRGMISAAERLIGELAGEIVKYSRIYETQAWGKTSQPAFLNQVVEITSRLQPKQLLNTLQQIEDKLGRVRGDKWGERIIDIDILYYGNFIHQEKHLKIPHPEIPYRRFTLVPLVEIAPEFINPLLLKSNSDILAECNDVLKVQYYNLSVPDIK